MVVKIWSARSVSNLQSASSLGSLHPKLQLVWYGLHTTECKFEKSFHLFKIEWKYLGNIFMNI